MSSKKCQGKARPGLAQGQLWKLNHLYIQIVELGKRLIHYRMLSDLKETGARIKTSSVDVLWRYLQSRHARLLSSTAGQ
jgi:hypothetical protein